MNNMIKYGLVFVAGAGFGSLATVFIVDKKYKHQYEHLVEEEIASVKETFARKQADPEIKKIVKNEDKRPLSSMVRELGYTKNAFAEEEKEYQDGDLLTEEANDLATNGEEPYVITTEQFSEEMLNFEKLTVYYYEDDDVLADEQEEVIPNVVEIVGEDNLTKFGYLSEDPEILYIRNEKMEVDYEVIRLSKSYQETVLKTKKEAKKKVRKLRGSEKNEE